jgi:hypothetical protein
LLTAVCSTVNLAYFCYRLSAHPPETASRRAAAVVLAAVSFATVVESVALLAAASGSGSPVEAPGWALVRGLALTGALGMAVLVIRKVVSR